MRSFSLQLILSLIVATFSATLVCGCGGNVLTVGTMDLPGEDAGPPADSSLAYPDSDRAVEPDSTFVDTGYPQDSGPDVTVEAAEDAAIDTSTDAAVDSNDADADAAADSGTEAAPADATADGADTGDATVGDVGPDGDSASSAEGGGMDSSSPVDSGTDVDAAQSYTIGGTVSGLAAGDVIAIVNNGSLIGQMMVTSNGPFTLPTSVPSGSHYVITVVANPVAPVSQTCTVTMGTGTATATVTDVTVICVTNFTVGGTIDGLAPDNVVVLVLNSGDALHVTGNGSPTSFTFSMALTSGSAYAVAVSAQPSTSSQYLQTCAVSAGTGTVANSNVTTVSVFCSPAYVTIGGTISGLTGGESVVLLNNGGDALTVQANGSFTFLTPLADPGTYSVTVQPPDAANAAICSVSSGTGTSFSVPITSVIVTCVAGYTVGGTVTGLTGNETIQLANGGDTVTLTANSGGTFTFPTPVRVGGSYNVTITSAAGIPPPACTITKGSGTVSTDGNVSNILVTCSPGIIVSGVVTGLLPGQSVQVSCGAGDTVVISAQGVGGGSEPFACPLPLLPGAYMVTAMLSANGTCTVTNAMGSAATNVTNVAISCP